MSQTLSNPATLRLPFKEKLAYGMGDLGSNILLDIGTLYLLKFYTDVLGLPGTYGGIIFLIAKFFTAFTDMGTGIMLDSRRKIGPKGKFRPFVLYAAFPVTLLAIANFVGTPFEVTGKTVMATVLFMLYGLFFSMMNCSYGAMVPAITKNPDERASLAAWRQGGATLGLLLCTVGFVPVMNLIEGNSQLSYISPPPCFRCSVCFLCGCVMPGLKSVMLRVSPSTIRKNRDYSNPSALSPGTARCLFFASRTYARSARSTSNSPFRFITPSTCLTTPFSFHGWAFSAWAVFLSACF